MACTTCAMCLRRCPESSPFAEPGPSRQRGWMMIRSLRFCCVLLVGLFASACGDSTSEQVCTPGTEVFCKCRGGSVQGTQTCADDGQSLGECTTPEGECPSIGTGTTDGPIGICTPDEVITCTCDNADQGTKTCSGDGLSFTDCTTPDGPCGRSAWAPSTCSTTCSISWRPHWLWRLFWPWWDPGL